MGHAPRLIALICLLLFGAVLTIVLVSVLYAIFYRIWSPAGESMRSESA